MLETVAAPVSSPPAPIARPRRRLALVGRGLRRAYWPAVLGLIGLNAWWLWDARPMPPLRYVEGWIGVPREPAGRSVPWWDVTDVPHDNRGALAVLWRAVRKSPNDGDARVLLGRALGAAKQYRPCAEQLRLVPAWSPRKAEALFGEGMAWLELHRVRDAQAALLAYVTIDPNHPNIPRPNRITAENKLWDIYALEDRMDDGRALAWRAYRDASGQPSVQVKILEMIMRMRVERSHPVAIVENLREILAADPDDWDACRAVARALNSEAVKDYEGADREIARCLAERPKDPRIWGDWLEMLQMRGDSEGLKAALAKAPPEADADGRTWLIRGRVATQARDHARAAEAYRRAVQLLPSEMAASYELGMALRFLGKTEEAAAHLRRHAELEATVKEVPQKINQYRDITEEARPDPAEIRRAMLELSAACRKMGWPEEADAWAAASRAF